MHARRLAVAVFSFLVFAGGLTVPAAERQQLASVQVTALIDQSRQALRTLREDEALARVNEALALAEKTNDRVGIAMSYRMQGQVLRQLNRYADSTSSYQRALAAFEALGNEAGIIDVLTGLAATAITLGQTGTVRELGDRALLLSAKAGNERSRAYLLQVLGGSDAYAELAGKWQDEVAELAKRIGDDWLLGETAVRRANRHFQAGR